MATSIEEKIEENVNLLAKIPREIYESGDRGIGDALELILLKEDGKITADFLKYNWEFGERENDKPLLKEPYRLTENQNIQLDAIYKLAVSSLIEKEYFVEEQGIKGNRASILMQPVVADADFIDKLVNNQIAYFKEINSPRLERPKIEYSEQGYRGWLVKYHEANGMNLPKDFNKKTFEQLQGMFYGMTNPEKIEERLRKKAFVTEFYGVHHAKLPFDFSEWGDKQIEVLYKELIKRYGKENVQFELFKPIQF